MRRLSRVFAALGLLLGSTVVVFALLEAAPDGLNREPRVHQPIVLQYVAWLFRVLRGDLGWSSSNAQPVSQTIAERLPATIELAIFAFLAMLVVGAFIGFVRARARASKLHDVLAVPPLLLRAIPVVILTLFLLLLAAISGALPAAGIASVDAFDVRDRIAHLIAPVLCFAVPFGAWASLIFYDLFRASENASRPSVRGVVGAIAATAALIGPASMGGGFIIELMFAWPGEGRLFYNGLSQHDLPLAAGLLLLYSAGVVLIKFCAGLVVDWSDRTARHQSDSPQRSATRWKGLSATGIFGFVVLLVAAFGAVAASLLAPAGPYFIDQAHWQGYPLAPGVAGHALGTDENGRDLLSRLLIGARTSLGVAAIGALIATAIGAAVAKALSAVSWSDERGALGFIGIRPFAALPFIFVTVAVLAARHTAAVLSPLVIASMFAAVSWPAIVPVLRAFTPATLRAGVVNLVACGLLLEVTLSRFGYGVQPPAPSLGNMLVNVDVNITVAPWVAIIPSVVVIVLLFGLYAVADDLREL